MKKLSHQPGTEGFTLVELLVVVAIIALLMALVMPVISSALLQGRVTATAANGRNIYQGIVAEQTRAIYRPQASPWPTVNNEDHGGTTAEYFIWLVESEIMNVSWGFFSAPGLGTARDSTEFTTSGTDGQGYNAWRVVDRSENIPETAPFLFTRNLDLGSLSGSDGSANESIDEDLQPFGDRALALVTRGGASYALLSDDLDDDEGNFGGVWNVLRADGSDIDRTVREAH